jgi:hypothetical protein
VRRHRPTLAAACLVAALAGGCASPKKPPPDARAPSLVYSPAARLPAEKTADPTPATATDDAVRPPAGRRVRLHFRREAIGVAGQAAYPITGGNNLAADRASVTGTLERVGRDWLVVRGDRSTHWVPREAVLAVEFVDPP